MVTRREVGSAFLMLVLDGWVNPRLATSRISILFHQSIIIINLLNELRVIYYLLLASPL